MLYQISAKCMCKVNRAKRKQCFDDHASSSTNLGPQIQAFDDKSEDDRSEGSENLFCSDESEIGAPIWIILKVISDAEIGIDEPPLPLLVSSPTKHASMGAAIVNNA